MSFWGEIKRRKVFRVAAVYAVVGWLIIQVVSAVAEPLRLPDWIDTVTIVLLIAGFPIAVILAWAFDITADGIVSTPPHPKIDSKAQAGLRYSYVCQ
jgi:adenylate cyclase